MHRDARGAKPPKASPAVWVPAPAKRYLAQDKDPPMAHVVPLYSSVQVTKLGAVLPPKASPSFCVPAPPKPNLPVFKFPDGVEDHAFVKPLYSSVDDTADIPGACPPKASPSFCVPAPAERYLGVIILARVDHVPPLYASTHDSI